MRRARYRFALASPARLTALRGDAIRATGDRGASAPHGSISGKTLSSHDPASAAYRQAGWGTPLKPSRGDRQPDRPPKAEGEQHDHNQLH